MKSYLGVLITLVSLSSFADIKVLFSSDPIGSSSGYELLYSIAKTTDFIKAKKYSENLGVNEIHLIFDNDGREHLDALVRVKLVKASLGEKKNFYVPLEEVSVFGANRQTYSEQQLKSMAKKVSEAIRAESKSL